VFGDAKRGFTNVKQRIEEKWQFRGEKFGCGFAALSYLMEDFSQPTVASSSLTLIVPACRQALSERSNGV
jgi:hypothetical protein